MGCCLTYPSIEVPLRPAHVDESKSFALLEDFGNARMSYVLEGDSKNPLIVCVHGIEGGKWVYDKMAPFLVDKGYRVLRFDFFGRGSSDLPEGTHNARFYIAQLACLLRTLKLFDVKKTIIGHSMGGAITVCYAAQYPKQIENLVLLAPAGFVEDPAVKCFKSCPCCGDCFFGVGESKFLSNLDRAIYRPTDQPELVKWVRSNIRQAAHNNPGYFPSVFMSIRDFPLDDIRAEAQTLGEHKEIPILLLWGDKDFEGGWGVPYANHKKYLQFIPHVQFHTFKFLHHLFYLEDPASTHEVVGKFLSASAEERKVGSS